MAVPEYIDVRKLCEQSLKSSGQPLPHGPMIQECVNIQFQDVKSDFQFVAKTHPLLISRILAVTTKGVRMYPQPEDLHGMIQVLLLDGPDEYRGTFVTPTTLSSAIDVEEDAIVGMTLLLTGGTGALQWRFITGWDNATKTPTVDTAWAISPDETTTYLIVNEQCDIFNADKTKGLDKLQSPGHLGRPRQAANFGEEIWLDVAPDKVYGLQYEYYADISKIDEDSALMQKLLREKFSFFMQGLVVKNMLRFDDDRYRENVQIYQRYVDGLSNETKRIGQTVPFG